MTRQRFHVDLREGLEKDFRIGMRWETDQPNQPLQTVWTEPLTADAIVKLPEIDAE